MGGATGCFSESFAYQGVYCPSELSLFSRPPSWQLVRTPKVIRLHNTHTHTVPLRNLLQNTSARRSPLSRSVFRRIFYFFFVCSAFFVALRHQPGQLRNFRPAGFRSDGSGVHSHTLKLTEIADSTQFFPFLCLFFRCLQEGTTFFFFLRGQTFFFNFLSLSRVTTGNGHLFHRFLNGDHLSSFTIRNIPLSRELPSCCCSSSSPLCGQGPSLFFFFC